MITWHYFTAGYISEWYKSPDTGIPATAVRPRRSPSEAKRLVVPSHRAAMFGKSKWIRLPRSVVLGHGVLDRTVEAVDELYLDEIGRAHV